MKRCFAIVLAFLLFFIFSNKIFSYEKNALNDFKFSLLSIGDNEKEAVEQSSDIKEKSVSKALFYSFILPGLGERYVGKNRLSKYLVISEVALWGSYIFHNVYSGWIEDDYRLFSTQHAGVNIDGKDKKYFVNMGNFFDIHKYNNKKRLDREYELVYNDVSGYYWRWDSDVSRREFKDMRIKSDQYSNRSNYFITGIFLNHIISGINAAISAKRFNKSIKSASHWKLEYKFGHSYYSDNMELTLKYHF